MLPHAILQCCRVRISNTLRQSKPLQLSELIQHGSSRGTPGTDEEAAWQQDSTSSGDTKGVRCLLGLSKFTFKFRTERSLSAAMASAL